MAEISAGPARVARIMNEKDGDRNTVEINRRPDGLYSVATFGDGAMCRVTLYPIHLAELSAALDEEIEKL